jgi:hypothetical protein
VLIESYEHGGMPNLRDPPLSSLGSEDEPQEFSKLLKRHLLRRIIRIYAVNNHNIKSGYHRNEMPPSAPG